MYVSNPKHLFGVPLIFLICHHPSYAIQDSRNKTSYNDNDRDYFHENLQLLSCHTYCPPVFILTPFLINAIVENHYPYHFHTSHMDSVEHSAGYKPIHRKETGNKKSSSYDSYWKSLWWIIRVSNPGHPD